MAEPIIERRKPTDDRHIIAMVVRFVGWPIAGLSLALGVSLVVTVIYMSISGKESPMFTPLITSVAAALGAGLGYMGGLLSNPRAGTGSSASEIGKSIVDEAQKANGLPVQDATSEQADEIARLNGVIADLQAKLGESPAVAARVPLVSTEENQDATDTAN